MDWAKAKSVLIAVFLILNIVLAIIIGVQTTGNGISKDMINNTVSILNQKGVAIKCEIPAYSGWGAGITFEPVTDINKTEIIDKLLGSIDKHETEIKYGEELVSGTKKLIFKDQNSFLYEDESPEGNADISSIQKAEKYISDLIKNLKLQTNSKYILFKSKDNMDGSYTVVFVEKYDNFMIFDNCIKAVVSKNGIHTFEHGFRKIRDKGFSRDTEKVMPAYQVLVKNLSILDNEVITRIDLGFNVSSLSQDMKGSVEILVWQVELENSPVMYFNAYTGEKQ